VVVNDLGATLDGRRAASSRRTRWWPRSAAPAARRSVDGGSVADWNGAHAMVRSAPSRRFGRIDIVVNNAGILRDVMFHRMSEAEWDAVDRRAPEGQLQRQPRRGAALQGAGRRRLSCT
jgi:NAD(P)-dependent dehydrogenase (short-subunit alcohol dehydrogenase family)